MNKCGRQVLSGGTVVGRSRRKRRGIRVLTLERTVKLQILRVWGFRCGGGLRVFIGRVERKVYTRVLKVKKFLRVCVEELTEFVQRKYPAITQSAGI